MKLNNAVLRALDLVGADAEVTCAEGASGFSSTAKIKCAFPDGTLKHFFMKTGPGQDGAIMFEGEHASLNAIHNAVPRLCPASLAFGALDNSPGYFLVTEYLDFSARGKHSQAGSGISLAAKLAQLHTTPAPIPPGQPGPVYGFPVVTCCGDTPQPNEFNTSWADFFAENRLKAILARSESRNGQDPELRHLVEATVQKVVPRLLGDDHLNGGRRVTPVVVHGDLWSGNKGRATRGGTDGEEEVVFDPRCVVRCFCATTIVCARPAYWTDVFPGQLRLRPFRM